MMKMIYEEQWKPVVGYESRYQVSNLGRVQRVDLPEPRILGLTEDAQGIPTILLCNGPKRTVLQLRTLVARHWIENPSNFSYARNRSEDLLDCSVDNLYWSKVWWGDGNRRPVRDKKWNRERGLVWGESPFGATSRAGKRLARKTEKNIRYKSETK